jgi:hypothetical protein
MARQTVWWVWQLLLIIKVNDEIKLLFLKNHIVLINNSLKP